MEVNKITKADFEVFSLSGELNTAACIGLKSSVNETLETSTRNICFDLSGLVGIDQSGFRFLGNLQKVLAKQNRVLVSYSVPSRILGQLKNNPLLEKPIECFESIHEFENTLTNFYEGKVKSLLNLAEGSGVLKGLHLGCPLCKWEGFVGYLLDISKHQLLWEENDITPQWKMLENKENQIDFDLYRVAVCPRCYFASDKLDHFKILLPEGNQSSVLKPEILELLSEQAHKRTTLMADYNKNKAYDHFGYPRDKKVGYYSYKLLELTVRNLSKNKKNINTFELAISNILAAKYAKSEELQKNDFSTAHVWLKNLIENPQGFTSKEMAMAYVYLVSVSLALERVEEAKEIAKKYNSQFAQDSFYQFYTDRMDELLAN